MKSLFVFADGIWKSRVTPYLTNICKIAQSIEEVDAQSPPTVIFCDEEGKLLGGAFGSSIDNNIEQAYQFLSFNYREGDKISGASTLRTSLLVLLISFIVIQGPAVWAQTRTESDAFLQNLATLSELRTQAESRVRLLQALQADGEIPAQILRRGELLYEDARAAMNSWLDAVERGYEIYGGSPRNPVPEKLQQGARSAGDFLSYADDLILGEKRNPAVIVAALGLIPKVIEAGASVWKAWREMSTADQQKRKEFILDLDKTAKWSAFETIK